MGYTHYFRFNPIKKGSTKQVESSYQLAVLQCQRLVSRYNMARPSGDDTRLAGYAAHCKPGMYKGLKINGRGENAHEDFILREHYKQNDVFNFCKTARKPYDLAVVACLVILKHYLGESIQVSSDGDVIDWRDGTKLARQLLRLKTIKNPLDSEVKHAKARP